MAMRLRGFRRKIDGWGRIVLPKPLLERFGLGPSHMVEIYPTERGFFVKADHADLSPEELERIEGVEM